MENEHDVVEGEFSEGQLAPPKSTLDHAIETRERLGQLARPINVSEMLAAADKQIEFRRGLVKLIATKIDPHDVVIYGNTPAKFSIHFSKAACKQILSWVQADVVNVRITQTSYEGKEGPYIVFECSADMLIGGRRVNVIGSRATYDDFFGSEGKYDEQGKKTTVQKPLDEIDIPSVRMAAVTNMWNHALEDAGLKPSLEELKNAGLDLGKASYVQFREGGKAPEQTKQAQTATGGDQKPPNGGAKATAASDGDVELISEAQAKRLFAIAKNLGWSTEQYRAALASEFAVNRDTGLPKSRYAAAEKYFIDNRKS